MLISVPYLSFNPKVIWKVSSLSLVKFLPPQIYAHYTRTHPDITYYKYTQGICLTFKISKEYPGSGKKLKKRFINLSLISKYINILSSYFLVK